MSESVKAYKGIEDYPPVLQARHVQEMLGISNGKAYEILNSQKCPTIKIGKRLVVFKDSFVQFLHNHEGAEEI